jgi:hypothetical protein
MRVAAAGRWRRCAGAAVSAENRVVLAHALLAKDCLFLLSDDEVKALRLRAWQYLRDASADETIPGAVEVRALAELLDVQIARRFGRWRIVQTLDGPAFVND